MVVYCVCGKCSDDMAMRVCSTCRVMRYCSRECQVAYWPQHKQVSD